MKLCDSVKASHEALQIAVIEANRELAISEQRYVSYWFPHYDDRTIEENIFTQRDTQLSRLLINKSDYKRTILRCFLLRDSRSIHYHCLIKMHSHSKTSTKSASLRADRLYSPLEWTFPSGPFYLCFDDRARIVFLQHDSSE